MFCGRVNNSQVAVKRSFAQECASPEGYHRSLVQSAPERPKMGGHRVKAAQSLGVTSPSLMTVKNGWLGPQGLAIFMDLYGQQVKVWGCQRRIEERRRADSSTVNLM